MTVPWLMNCPHLEDGWCLDCTKELGEENWDLQDKLKKEKQRRIYYQDIVYKACNLLGKDIVCGTIDNPSTEVQDKIRELKEENMGLQHEINSVDYTDRGKY